MAAVSGTIALLVDRDGTHVEVRDAAGTVVWREGVGSPTSTVERQARMTCTALLPAEGAEQLARVLLNATTKARGAEG